MKEEELFTIDGIIEEEITNHKKVFNIFDEMFNDNSSLSGSIYALFKNDKIFYIGQTTQDLKIRLNQHLHNKSNCSNKLIFQNYENDIKIVHLCSLYSNQLNIYLNFLEIFAINYCLNKNIILTNRSISEFNFDKFIQIVCYEKIKKIGVNIDYCFNNGVLYVSDKTDSVLLKEIQSLKDIHINILNEKKEEIIKKIDLIYNKRFDRMLLHDNDIILFKNRHMN